VECLTKTECSAISKYTKDADDTCISDTECTAVAGFFKDVSELDCLTVCPAGQYKDNDDKVCRTKAECDTESKYTNDSDMTCITKTDCLLTPTQFVDTSHLNCVTTCLAGEYKDNDERECRTKAECDGESKFTKNSDMTCVTGPDCISVAGYFKDVSGLNCVTTCPVSEYKDVDLKECLTKVECTAASKFTKDDTDECLTSAQCVANPGFMTLASTSTCLDTCPTNYFKETSLL
jgi:hypothetical protein